MSNRTTRKSSLPNDSRYRIGLNSTAVTKFIYDPTGELVATIRAPDDNSAGIEFARVHAERIVNALNHA